MILAAVHLQADDGAASIAAGGIVVMRREPRIAMAKEVLQISASKVVVDYDFRNDSDENITTDVAFPIPDYSTEERTPAQQGFDDFQLSIDGASVHYLVETRAFLKDKEYTGLLVSMKIDIASFGHVVSLEGSRDLRKLTAVQRGQLEKAGLIDSGVPLWRVQKKYHWRQTFPAHKIVHIRHEYSPVVGSENSIEYGMRADPDPRSAEEINSFCVDGQLHATLQRIADGKDKDKTASYNYVDFILTTANTWKTPIEDFTLIVERPHWKSNQGESDLADYVSFCWDGPVTKLDADHFSAHAINLVPAKEIRIGFFGIEHNRF